CECIDERQVRPRLAFVRLHLLCRYAKRCHPCPAKRHVPDCACKPRDNRGNNDGEIIHSAECHGPALRPARAKPTTADTKRGTNILQAASVADLTFLSPLPRVRCGNVKSKATLALLESEKLD